MLILMSLSPTTYRYDIGIDLDGNVYDTAIIIWENVGNLLQLLNILQFLISSSWLSFYFYFQLYYLKCGNEGSIVQYAPGFIASTPTNNSNMYLYSTIIWLLSLGQVLLPELWHNTIFKFRNDLFFPCLKNPNSFSGPFRSRLGYYIHFHPY